MAHEETLSCKALGTVIMFVRKLSSHDSNLMKRSFVRLKATTRTERLAHIS